MRLSLLSRTNNNLTAGRCYLCKNSLGASFPKGVFIRNPTETDEEIFTCIQPLPISLQPVLAQLCSAPSLKYCHPASLLLRASKDSPCLCSEGDDLCHL